MAASDLISRINEQIINPLIVLLFGLALILFLWGVFNLIRGAGDDEGRETGKRHIIWGIVGMVIMFSVFGILRLALGTFGVDLPN